MHPIAEFLSVKRIAMVGVSRKAADYTRIVFNEFANRGYDIQPVNPNAPDIAGIPCRSSVAAIQPPVEAALLLTKPPITEMVARECAESGVRLVWMRQKNPEIAADLEKRGIKVIDGECPLMFLENPGFPHKFHGWIRKLTGKYPALQA